MTTTKIPCDVCKKLVKHGEHYMGYGKTLCSVECFQEAGKTYKPNGDSNRGGGVGKERVSI